MYDALLLACILVGAGLLGGGAAYLCGLIDDLYGRYLSWSLKRERAEIIALLAKIEADK